MGQTPSQDKAGMSRGLRLLLIGSLGFNLLIVGAVAGALLLKPGDDRRRPPRLDAYGGPLSQALTHADRHTIGKEMRKAYRQERPERGALREDFKRLAEDLRRVPFDPAPVRARLETQRQDMVDRFAVGQVVLLKRLTEMTDAERAAFADRLESSVERRSRSKDW